VKNFETFFHSQNHEKICNNNNTEGHQTSMCCYITLWNINILKQQLKTILL